VSTGRTVPRWHTGTLVAAAALLSNACAPIESTSPATGPRNACPAFPCANYLSSSPATCEAGVCVVSAPAAQIDALIVVVAVPTDSSFAPGRTFAVTLQDLQTPYAADGCSSADCCLPTCAPLPGIEIVNRAYVVAPSLQSGPGGVNWDLDNAPGEYTALPVQATYQPQWGGPTGPYAISIGLPLEPIAATAFASPLPGYPGPGDGPGIVVQSYLQEGLTYQLTDQPDPPYSAAYPPEVLSFTPTGTGEAQPIVAPLAIDTTTETGVGTQIPTFDIKRAAGLDGWTAYLRDATNLDTVSNVVTMSGTEAPAVRLATDRFAGTTTDALSNAQLVIAPPAGTLAPTYVAAPIGNLLPVAETYPPLPAPVVVTAEVTAGGVSAPTNLTFEATDILVDGVETMSNFTYTASVTTTTDALGRATFSIALPPGEYLVVARPFPDAPPASATTLASVVVPETGPLAAPAIALATTQSVTGLLVTGDGRPVSYATVEAIPTGCATLPTSVFDSPFLSTSECLPRPGTTTSTADGLFALSLDPGQYLLRARPADGTAFPWVMTAISVANEPVAIGPLVVPLPLGLAMRLVDTADNPIVQALVRVYSLPTTGQAIELGNALTDDNGQFSMFVSLAQP
jgi:hypothetical protein